MHILVTNDDGIKAEGIKQLVNSLQEVATITVVAPTQEKSACGHGITVIEPIKVSRYDWGQNINAFAIDGTPADCVKLGLNSLLRTPPDLVVSGINKGANLGTDVLYSGTVSAAIESVIHDIPALAFSLDTYVGNDFMLAQDVVKYLCKEMLTKRLAHDTLLNINIPYIEKSQLKGFKATKLGERKYKNIYVKETDDEKNDYYLLKGKALKSDLTDEEIDIIAIKNNYVSITPIHLDLTNYQLIEKVNEWNLKNKDF
ncbi:5'-nucleotidase /3'-nucleotidase /exopolyphosphatase [Desulfonispora thiosulfatigenes DSM 11270]|uniref:5'-nucleotidase SurE n=1 Tax=Desulfonispora thiosulfatigenes DSM 11270 TaxID=656914 RepID=A0A1W1VNX4_DESTI|nr:5'/3'-nucleotidase SurE [Desulfonispora thiosulfatigenes]SMB94634.1 5'-nucleotidase /3'-nucleotidase /exopolyphosphatase [Desulfonispora thiosulfatigenes DSM 11270]